MFNLMKTAVLMAAITALFMAIGSLIGGKAGMMLALAIAVAMNFFSYWFSDKLVLRMYNAQEVDETTAPQFYRTVRELAQRRSCRCRACTSSTKPRPTRSPPAAVPIMPRWRPPPGILRVLTDRELRGVMAHELAHVRHRDILISTVSATMAGAIGMLANFAMLFGGRNDEGRPANPIVGLLVMLLAPIAASLIQMAISRAREFEADRGGAEISGDPQALASALQKIQRYAQGIPLEGRRTPPRNRADDDHESAVRRRHPRPLLHAPLHRGASGAVAGDAMTARQGCAPVRRRCVRHGRHATPCREVDRYNDRHSRRLRRRALRAR
jgi:heat shock protein HtpX